MFLMVSEPSGSAGGDGWREEGLFIKHSMEGGDCAAILDLH